MATQIQLRRATAAEWAANDAILAEGEPGVDLTTGLLKIGNGVDPWSILPPIAEGAQGPQGEPGEQGPPGTTGDWVIDGTIASNSDTASIDLNIDNKIYLNSKTKSLVVDDGVLQLPVGGDIVNSSGDSVLTGGVADTGDITFNGIQVIGAETTLPQGSIELIPNAGVMPVGQPHAGDTYTSWGQYVQVFPTWNADAPHIHIAAGSGSNSEGDIFLGDDNKNVQVNHDGSVHVKTAGMHDWTFNNEGNIQLPSGGDIVDSTGASVLGVPAESNYIVDGAAAQWYTLQAFDASRRLVVFPAAYDDPDGWGYSGIVIPTDEEHNFPIGTVIDLAVLNGATWVTHPSLDNEVGYISIGPGSFYLIKIGNDLWTCITNTGSAGDAGQTGPQGPDGVQGPTGSTLIGFQILTVAAGTATHTPTTGTTKFMVIAIGGGGGSGRAVGSTLNNQVSGGGGSGAWCSKYVTSVQSSYSYTYTVGAGGAGDTGAGTGGSTGGTTTFSGNGISLSAPGGAGGASKTTTDPTNLSIVTSTAGATLAAGGDTNCAGNPATIGVCGPKTQIAVAEASNGGHTPWGVGGWGGSGTDGMGVTPSGFGGGAGGAYAASATPKSGAAGANGAILIWEYS